MSRASNSLLISDVITTPIKLKYTSSYASSSLSGVGITVWSGSNTPSVGIQDFNQSYINYVSIRNLYYSNFLTGSYLSTSSSIDNSLQSTAASGTLDADVRYFPTQSGATVTVMSIPRSVFGEKISRQSFNISSSNYNIVDDGNGNILDLGGGYYVASGYFTPEGPLGYAYQGKTQVGNIIYAQGMVIITNQDYINIIP